MFKNILPLVLMIISEILIMILTVFLKRQKKGQIKLFFSFVIYLMFFWTFSLILQILFQNSKMEPVVFEKIAVVGATLLPVALLILSITFYKTRLIVKKYYLGLLIIPIASMLIMWSEHINLMYSYYSVYINETKFGPYFYIHSAYTYILYGISIFLLLKYSIKNAGFFSKQSLLIVTGTLIPIIVNVLGTFQIIPMTVYITPICFSLTILFFALAIFKFKFLSVTPIAMQKIVDRISDSFVVINDELVIIDYNETMIHKFGAENMQIRNKSLEEIIRVFDPDNSDNILEQILDAIKKTKNNKETIVIREYFKKIDKYFNIEVNSIFSKKVYIGSLVLFKDITQHIRDQEFIASKEQLYTLGEIAGGFAHDLNSPLRSIAGDIYNLKVYFNSGNIEVKEDVKQDVKEVFSTLDSNINNMSKMINTFKDQMVNTGDKKKEYFNLLSVAEGVKILLGGNLRRNKCVLNLNIDKNINIYGEDNKLSRTITNLVKNSIEAYAENNKYGEITVNAIIDSKTNSCVITIEDYAGGIPEEIAKTIFKERKTTKKSSGGTGIGLYSTYRLVIGDFRGKMEYENIEKDGQKGTRFIIQIPVE